MSAIPSGHDLPAAENELATARRNFHTLLAVARTCRNISDPMDVLQAMYHHLSDLVPVDAFSVAVATDADPNAYRYLLMIDEGVRYPANDTRTGGLTGYIIEHQSVLLFRDLHHEILPSLPEPHVFGNAVRRSRAWIGVPLLGGRGAFGAVTVQSYQPAVYDETDVELVKALADIAAVAMENALLYQQQSALTRSLAQRVTERQRELAVLRDIAGGLSRGRVTTPVLHDAIRRLVEQVDCQRGELWLVERQAVLRQMAGYPTRSSTDVRLTIPIDSPELEAVVARHGQVRQQATTAGWLCGIPLRAQGRTIGLLTLESIQQIDGQSLSFLLAGADQIALGIDNSQLLQERDRQIAHFEALDKIAQQGATALDGEAMLHVVLAILPSVLSFDGFWGAMWDATDHTFRNGISWQRRHGLMPVTAQTMTGKRINDLLIHRQPRIDWPSEPASTLPPWEQDACTWMGVPLHDQNADLIGVLALQSARADAYDTRDLQFMTNVAHHVALNAVNARLYQSARGSAAIAESRAHKLAIVHQVSRRVSASLDPAEVARIAAEQMARLLNAQHGLVLLLRDETTVCEVVAEFPTIGALGYRWSLPSATSFESSPGSKQPSIVQHIAHDDRIGPLHRFLPVEPEPVVLLVPLQSRGRTFGAVVINIARSPATLGADDLDLCRTIAAQITTALDNAHLHEMAVTRVEQELDIARAIQANLFPRLLPSIPGMLLAGRCIPAFETGGDFYDVLPLGKDRFGFSIGDVSGKSLSAAMLMAVARSIVRSEALDHPTSDEVITETNRLILQDIPPKTFVALCYAVYDPPTRELEITNAGQITPLVRHASGQVEWLPVQPHLPLGIVPDIQYRASTVKLDPGDTIVFLTDGVIEAFGANREMWGFERTQLWLSEHGGGMPDEVVMELLEQVVAWQGKHHRHDDMTVIVAKLI
ncbi:MAG: hypothetical protein NVS2B7_09250 [Herpetosiphon sp.]